MMLSQWKISCRQICFIIGCCLVGWCALMDQCTDLHLRLSKSTKEPAKHHNNPSITYNMHYAPEIIPIQKSGVETVLNTFRICADSTMDLPFRTKNEGSFITYLHYQCRGAAYDEFADKLEQYIAQNSPNWPLWGHRPFPIPDNKKVLIVGNSHTRQSYQALMCQYQSLMDHAKKLDQWTGAFHFQNNSTLVTTCNTPFVYSNDWAENIESIVGMPLSTFDAIVVGTFNEYDPETETTFRTNMLAFSESHPEVDFKNVPAPTAEDFARIYSGPLIMFGMFGKPKDDMVHEAAKRLISYWKESSNRTNIKFLSGRVHIDNIGIEAISRDRVNVGLLYTDQGHHRCVGPRGGHPDLLAWEFVETLHNLLE